MLCCALFKDFRYTFFCQTFLTPDTVADCERRVHDLLCSLPNYQITLDRFMGEYEKMYGSKMDYYGHSKLTSLLESFSSTLTVRATVHWNH